MSLAPFGHIALIGALISTITALGALSWGGVDPDRRRSAIEYGRMIALTASVLVAIASIILWVLLWTRQYQVAYVFDYTSNDLPALYTFTAFWAGQSGSILLWEFVLSIFVAVVLLDRRNDRQLVNYATAVMLLISTFFLSLLVSRTNPFELLPIMPPNGKGMNPQLQTPSMAIHPLMLYTGYVGLSVPFAYAIASLLIGRVDAGWIRQSRFSTMVAWSFLGTGILLGAQWAYIELGWGGYWAWDPVENASFLPWLTATAYLHSSLVQERRGMFKRWNMFLVILTFGLTVTGTFLTRSGIVSSIHAFTASGLGSVFMVFLAMMLLASLALLWYRAGLMKDERDFEAYTSKEGGLFFNNLIFVGLAVLIFIGTLFPVFTEWFRTQRLSLSEPYYNSFAVPMGIAMLVLLGIGPLLPWRKIKQPKKLWRSLLPQTIAALVTPAVLFAFGMRQPYALLGFGACIFAAGTIVVELWHNAGLRVRLQHEIVPVATWRAIIDRRRRYGAYIVHLAIIMISMAIIGTGAFKTDVSLSLNPGQTATVGGYQLKYLTFDKRPGENGRTIYVTEMAASKDGQLIGILEPHVIQYPIQESSTEVAIHSTLLEDLYVVLTDLDDKGVAVFHVFVNPLMVWMWIGGLVAIFGTIMALWPTEAERAVVPLPETAAIPAGERRQARMRGAEGGR